MIEMSEARLFQFIEQRIAPDLNSGCWLWTGNTHPTGYGVIGVRKRDKLKNTFAHRASWFAHKGQDPGRLKVCHRCDTPACVNPDHLFLGTQKDNLRDMYAKGRLVNRGSANGSAKLTDDQVRAIRRDDRTIDDVAKDYPCGRSTIWRVRRRDVYADVV